MFAPQCQFFFLHSRLDYFATFSHYVVLVAVRPLLHRDKNFMS